VIEEYKSTIEQLRKFAIKAQRLERLQEEKRLQEKRLVELAAEIKESKVEIDKIENNSLVNIYLKLTKDSTSKKQRLRISELQEGAEKEDE